MQAHINPDDVPLLWIQSPRFVQIMRSGSRFQHPHYFFDQSDKLTALLNRLVEDTALFGPSNDSLQAQEELMQLLNESNAYSSLTREHLRQHEPNVRSFVGKVQNVDTFALQWEERRRLMSAPKVSKKRGREDDEQEEQFSSSKRRRETCGAEAAYASSLQFPSAWMEGSPAQPMMWTEASYMGSVG